MIYNSERIRDIKNNLSKSYLSRPHLKLNPTLKEIKKFAYDWNNIEEDIRNFYLKCFTCGIRTSKHRKIYVVKHIELDYPREKYQVDTAYLANYISNNSNI